MEPEAERGQEDRSAVIFLQEDTTPVEEAPPALEGAVHRAHGPQRLSKKLRSKTKKSHENQSGKSMMSERFEGGQQALFIEYLQSEI